MKINGNSLWQWYISFFLGGKNRSKNIIRKANCRCDEVALSPQAKKQLRNAEIEKVINSGEPLKGVTYEEYRDYFQDKHGYLDNYKIEQEYRQALKGDNASLRQKEWRTNPEYNIPMRLYNSPEVTADREATYEKYRSGAELEDWERGLLSTFDNARDYDRIHGQASKERQVNIIQNRISDALSSAGIRLDKDTELTFEVWGRSLRVSGNTDEQTLKDIRKVISEIDCTKDNCDGMGYKLQGVYYRAHEGYAAKGGFELGFLMKAEELLQDEGSGVTVFDLSLDDEGNILGLPDKTAEFIKENAVGEFGKGIPEKFADREKTILKARYMKESFKSAVETIQKGDYDRLKAMTCKLTYKNGVLSC